MSIDLSPPKKTDKNPCPVCNRPRGSGMPFERSHGLCMEQMAKLEKTNVQKKTNQKQVAKRYLSGKLPSWMTNK